MNKETKLLTLEEIERYEKEVKNIENFVEEKEYNKLIAAIATARAYWEKKNDPKTAQETSYYYIGQLRQWLNECRITDPSKMVDNKDIMEWLGIPVPAGYRTDKEVISEALGINEDKPHPATIRAIVEALKEGTEFELKDGNNRFVFSSYDAIKSLEKHLE